MIKNILTITILTVCILISCSEHQKKTKNSIETIEIKSNSLEDNELIFGTYIGTIPCADCTGILKKLTLNRDNTFVIESIYNGKGDEKPFIEKGIFKVENTKLILSIKQAPSIYKIGIGYVEQLDIDGNQIQSSLNYKLTKK